VQLAIGQEGNHMSHEKQISTANPGLIMLMIDQSYSMEDPYGNDKKKVVAANAVNNLIYELQEASWSGDSVKPRCRVVVIGYGAQVHPIIYGMISDLATNYKNTKMITKTVNRETFEFELPIWIEAEASNGTPMAEAFVKAHELVEKWINEHPDSYPPVIINITDGEPNDMKATRQAAEGIGKLGTSDGKILVFNIHISSSSSEEVVLPDKPTGIDRYGNFLFDISSVLPDALVSQGQKAGFAPVPGSRGFVYNASPETLVKLLNFGSTAMR
jgi:hypothetical protein